MTAHTPGPWEVFGGYLVRAVAPSVPEVACPIADVHFPVRKGVGLSRGNAEQQANAHLIAAAPDLLDALQRMRTHDSAGGPCDVPGRRCDCIARADAALAKARRKP